MRLAYIDESGTGKVEHDPYLVVTAIIVNADAQMLDVKKHLRRMVEHFIPKEHQSGFVFHATELFNGGGKLFDRKNPIVSKDRCLEIADELAAIPKKFHLRIAHGWVDRRFFPRTFKLPQNMSPHEKTLHEHATAFLTCSALVDGWMRKHAKRENCMTIIEDNHNVRQLLRDVQKTHQRVLENELDPRLKRLFPYRHIQEDPLFQPKTSASPLEIADFCAYIWRRFLNAQQDPRVLRFIDPMRGNIVELG
jgi:hypothetical protein